MKARLCVLLLWLSMANLFAKEPRSTIILSYTPHSNESAYFAAVVDSFTTMAGSILGYDTRVVASAASLAEAVYEAGGKYHELWVVVNTHGVGWDPGTLSNFGSTEIHNDPSKEIDTVEGDLRQAGILINRWAGPGPQPVGLGVRVSEVRVDTFYTQNMGGNWINMVCCLRVRGVEFLAGPGFRTQGKSALIKKEFFVTADVNGDGLITIESFGPQSEEQRLLFAADFSDSSAYGEPIGEQEVGWVDIDNDGLADDFLFVYDGNELAIDVDCYTPDDPEPDGIDEDNDGIFRAIDLNSDGDTADLVWYKEGIVLSDGLLGEEEFRHILSSFPGTKVVLFGSCYGGGMIDQPMAKTVGYAFVNDTTMASGGALIDLARCFSEAQVQDQVNLLKIFNGITFQSVNGGISHGWLNDNEDDRISLLPLAGSMLGEDGFLSSIIQLQPGEYSAVSSVDEQPGYFSLAQNYPNPFNATTTIDFSTSRPTRVKVTIFNSLGQEVAVLVDEFNPSGQHKVVWDASNISSGLYFYRLEAGGQIGTKKMTLVK